MTTDFPLEVAAAVALEELLLEVAISDIDEIF